MATDRQGHRVPFGEAIKADRLDENTYRVNLRDDYCIGSVPNGGYTASCMLSAASAHLSSRGLPAEALVSHFEYPSRTSAGLAYVTVQDVKLGRQLSMLHLTLWQDGLLDQKPWITPSVSKPKLVAYSRHADLKGFEGLSLNVPQHVQIPPRPNFDALKASGTDGTWIEPELPNDSGFARSLRNWHVYLPIDGLFAPGILDFWMRFRDGEPITQAALLFVADTFPYNLHHYLHMNKTRSVNEDKQKPTKPEKFTELKPGVARSRMWFPTLSLNVEAKKALPQDGVEWVSVRVLTQQFKNGRFDLDVQIRDADGELVALSRQACLVVSMDRNTAGRSATKAAL